MVAWADWDPVLSLKTAQSILRGVLGTACVDGGVRAVHRTAGSNGGGVVRLVDAAG